MYGRVEDLQEVGLCTFVDAAFLKIAGSMHGQTCTLCKLVLGSGPDAASHPLGWLSHKQLRVARSSSAAEILAVVEAEKFGGAICLALEMICNRKVPHEVNVDSKALFDTITTQHETNDFRLRQAVSTLRERYEVGDISTLRWTAGKANPADALTKRGATTSILLNTMCSMGKLSVDFTSGVASSDA